MSSSEPSQNSSGHNASGVTGAREQWERDLLNPAIQKFPERRETFSSSSATQDRIYTPEYIDSGTYL